MQLVVFRIICMTSVEREEVLYYGCDFLKECGFYLKLDQNVITTASILFQRFFRRRSIYKYSNVVCAGACLLLASKIEEDVRKVREVINVMYTCLCYREIWKDCFDTQTKKVVPLDYYGMFGEDVGYEWRTLMIEMERQVLHECGFNLGIENHHKFILVYVNCLRERADAGDWVSQSGEKWRDMLQSAWNYGNDVLKSQIVVEVAVECIACACIHLAANDYDLCLPTRWYEVFGADVSDFQQSLDGMRRVYEIAEQGVVFRDVANLGIKRLFVPMKESC